MASDLDDAAATIEAEIGDNWADPTAISWDHDPSFTPPEADFTATTPALGVWIQPRILWGDGQVVTKSPGRNSITGVLNCNVFGPPDRGLGDVRRAADTFRDLFNRKTFSEIRFGVPSGPTVVEDDGSIWAQINISIPFIADELGVA